MRLREPYGNKNSNYRRAAKAFVIGRDLSLRSRFQKKLSVLLCVLYGQAVFFCPAKYQYTGTPANITSVITIVPTNEWWSLSINV